ncbi:MAG: primosomal protein N' [Oligoflexia bacterium]|nr:primosomal protein N' [Oligoflexia bacterium]
MGCIISISLNDFSENADKKISYKKISGPIDTKIILDGNDLSLFKWVSKYYHYSLGKLIFDTIPALQTLSVSAKRKSIKSKSPIIEKHMSTATTTFEPTNLQQQIINQLSSELSKKKHFKSLIHGVTGSGKSMIYLKLMEECFKNNQSVLFLLPEINLTPQFITIFENYLSVPIYPYHSALTEKQKLFIWENLVTENPASTSTTKLIIGARSSIFLPIDNLGLIIIDEEHDHSYKQDDRCTYHARDVAYKKAKLLNIPIILGSATPSIESFYFFKLSTSESTSVDDRYYFEIRERVNLAQLPDIELIDTRSRPSSVPAVPASTTKPPSHWPLTSEIVKEIKKNLESENQILILINRLGFANFFQCKSCGHSFECINCSTKLRFFSKKNILSCQYCSYMIPTPTLCPICNCLDILHIGFGTEKVQAILSTLFPEKIIERFDREEINTINKLNKRLDDFHQHKIDVLVGTQMLSKGHNFKKVKLVVILGVDSYLNYADFRINEKIYQLLTQVSGRSGRFGGESKVCIQTYNPTNETLNIVKENLFDQFYTSEINVRKECSFPPFSRLALIYLMSKDQQQVVKHTHLLFQILTTIRDKHFISVELLGPKTAITEKRVGFYTWCILFRTPNSKINDLHNLISTVECNHQLPSSLKMKIDIDPLNFM